MVYDFEGEQAEAVPGPHRALMFLELPRWSLEYGASRAVDLAHTLTQRITPGHAQLGQGRPVLVLPGFSAHDKMTRRLRTHLDQRGWHTHGWRLGANHGLTEAIVQGLPPRLTELADRYQQPISVVGWSFGGVLARWLAQEYPDHVRQVVCLGSPWRAEAEKTRATAMFEKSRVKHGIVDNARAIIDQARQPLRVPVTAVWSKTDGIVSWRGCRVDVADQPPAENVEVPSSHIGMVANPLVLAVVADRLAQDPAAWQPFTWQQLALRNLRPRAAS
ncbi:MAG: alpha/beta fold hydrolase [Nocardioidaceae bacterium]|nr:alpha/beta fold hydrolase [Nocardioidaceae bacterium]